MDVRISILTMNPLLVCYLKFDEHMASWGECKHRRSRRAAPAPKRQARSACTDGAGAQRLHRCGRRAAPVPKRQARSAWVDRCLRFSLIIIYYEVFDSFTARISLDFHRLWILRRCLCGCWIKSVSLWITYDPWPLDEAIIDVVRTWWGWQVVYANITTMLNNLK